MPQNHLFSHYETLSNISNMLQRFYDYCRYNRIQLTAHDRHYIKRCCEQLSTSIAEDLLNTYLKKFFRHGKDEANYWINTITFLYKYSNKR